MSDLHERAETAVVALTRRHKFDQAAALRRHIDARNWTAVEKLLAGLADAMKGAPAGTAVVMTSAGRRVTVPGFLEGDGPDEGAQQNTHTRDS